MAFGPAGKQQAEKAAVLAGCLAFGLLAIGSAMDRRSFLRPSAAERVPDLFASTALHTRGQADLAAGRPQDALMAGEAAVRTAPVDPVSPALLGAARLAVGDRTGAEKAFRVAGQMGWRVPLTQAYWMDQAIAVKDWRVAAERFDALLRQQPWLAENAQLLAAIEGPAEGRRAIVDRVAKARPPWLEAYARSAAEQPADVVERRAIVLDAIARRGMPLGCDAIAPPVSGLVHAGKLDAARTLWRDHCSEAGTGLIADADFGHLRTIGGRTNFEWELVGSSDVGLAVLPGSKAGQRVLELTSSAPASRTVLRQLVVMAPGAYRLSWQAATAQGRPSAQIQASLDCDMSNAKPLPATFRPESSSYQAEIRAGAECPARWLTFMLQPGEGEVRLQSVRLDRI
ncbi:hypothetical protein [Novosphingobium sp. TH158]|uniref:hypothetical protein n=1 Tax=Novosphingobium sp. TH158 TaxID=2067455 RepID=UPI000C7D5004|nr:hypothetical protein [Novosphingobium sp. TH158]PLK27106.1 hypothetical protein C0V78_09580 [Novosphingobium sp. TH158]